MLGKGITVQGVDVSGFNREEVLLTIDGIISDLGDTMVSLVVDHQVMYCSLKDLGLSWDNGEIIDEMFNLGRSGDVVSRYKAKKDIETSHTDFPLSFTLDEQETLAYSETFSSFNTEPEEAIIYTRDDLTPGIEGGRNGRHVDTAGAAALLMEAVDGWNGEDPLLINVPVEVVEPEVTYEELALIKDVLGTATTDYSFSGYSRAVNVENGCRKISGTLLKPGEYFSVTEAVTPFTAENGYEQAPSYEENRVVDSYGGGICQVSTTLYNAVLKAEMEVTARSNHTMAVSYVDLSKDAAIAEGSMDMAFVNNLEHPVYIIGYTDGVCITFTIYGCDTRAENRSIQFESVTLSTVEPAGAALYANPSQPVGYINQIQSPHTGYSAELWKNIYYDGEFYDSVRINSSYYNAVGTIYDVGVASQYPAVTQAMYGAISSQNLQSVQSVIASASTIGQPQSETGAQSEAQDQQQTPPTNAWGDVDETIVIN